MAFSLKGSVPHAIFSWGCPIVFRLSVSFYFCDKGLFFAVKYDLTFWYLRGRLSRLTPPVNERFLHWRRYLPHCTSLSYISGCWLIILPRSLRPSAGIDFSLFVVDCLVFGSFLSKLASPSFFFDSACWRRLWFSYTFSVFIFVIGKFDITLIGWVQSIVSFRYVFSA